MNIIPGKPVCRQLVSEILTYLYKIERLFNMQRKYCFYSSSLLVAYDARHLRQHCPMKDDGPVSFSMPKSVSHIIPGIYHRSGISEMFKSRMKKSISEPVSMSCEQSKPNQSESCNTNVSVDRLCQSSPSQFSLSCTNDVTKKDDGNDPMETKCNWVRIKMIDFTHVFPAENNDLDRNYRDGIQMLIQLLSLIKKSDCVH